jgi:hypothetical protein
MAPAVWPRRPFTQFVCNEEAGGDRFFLKMQDCKPAAFFLFHDVTISYDTLALWLGLHCIGQRRRRRPNVGVLCRVLDMLAILPIVLSLW